MKTRRSPEVAWPMALPMVSLIIVTLLVPSVPQSWPLWLSLTPPLNNTEQLASQLGVPLLIASGLVGLILGATIELRRADARPRQVFLRFFQDLFAYDFYLERVYNLTVVLAVSVLSKFTSWIDRFIVDGAVNFVGLATIFSGNALKYNVSGQSQFYILTILLGLSLLLLWSAINGQWSVIISNWLSSVTS